MPALNEVYLVDGASGGGGGLVLSTRRVIASEAADTGIGNQYWFLSGANKFNFPTIGTYGFRGEFRWSTGGTTHTVALGMDLAGTGTNIGLVWESIASRGADSATTPDSGTHSRRNSAGTMRVATGSTGGAGGILRVSGHIRILTLTRSIAPMFAFNTIITTPTVDAGTYFQVWKISDDPDFTTDSEWS